MTPLAPGTDAQRELAGACERFFSGSSVNYRGQTTLTDGRQGRTRTEGRSVNGGAMVAHCGGETSLPTLLIGRDKGEFRSSTTRFGGKLWSLEIS